MSRSSCIEPSGGRARGLTSVRYAVGSRPAAPSRYCRSNFAICANAGAATTPPKIAPRGSSTLTSTRRRGCLTPAPCRRTTRRTARRVAVRAGDLGRAGLAGDGVAGDLRRVARRAVLVDDAREHRLQLLVDRGRHDPPVLEARAASGRRRARRDAAGSRRRRSRSPRTPRRSGSASPRCPARSARCRSSCPTTGRAARTIPALSPGKSSPVDLPKPKRADPLRQVRRTELLGDRDRPDVDECERIFATVSVSVPRRSASWMHLSATWMPGAAELRLGVTSPSVSAPATVTTLNPAPG